MHDALVNEDFPAALGGGWAHVQTVRSQVRPPAAPTDGIGSTQHLSLPVNDGSGDRLAVVVHAPKSGRGGQPLVLLVHGLGGSAEATYVLATAAGLLEAGFPVARVDLRGAGRSGPSSTQMYHAGRTGDLRAVLAGLAETSEARLGNDEPNLALMGFSLGGNLTLKLLGEPLDGLPMAAGIAVSAPLDLAAGSEHLHHRGLGLYERAMLRGLRADVTRFDDTLTVEEREGIAAARRIEEFDDVYTARRNGWRDAAEYYAVNSSAQYLPRISTPTLVIHALDDPVIPSGPYRSIDWAALEENGYVRRAITAHGGHVGFHQRGDKPPWYVERAVRFLQVQT